MITAARLPELSAAGIRSVTALTHPQMFQLVQRKVHAATVGAVVRGGRRGKERRWTFAGVLERLKGIREETVTFNNTEVVLKTTPDEEQQRLLDLLGARL